MFKQIKEADVSILLLTGVLTVGLGIVSYSICQFTTLECCNLVECAILYGVTYLILKDK